MEKSTLLDLLKAIDALQKGSSAQNAGGENNGDDPSPDLFGSNYGGFENANGGERDGANGGSGGKGLNGGSGSAGAPTGGSLPSGFVDMPNFMYEALVRHEHVRNRIKKRKE